MTRGPINQKDLNVEFYYGYLNIHLERLQVAILKDKPKEVEFQLGQLEKARNALLKLGYFERGKQNDGKRKQIRSN